MCDMNVSHKKSDILLIKGNSSLTCCQFFNTIKNDEKILKKILSSEKYC